MMVKKNLYKVDAMDLHQSDVRILKKWLQYLEKSKPAGVCVPIKARMHNQEEYFDEWQPATNWDSSRR
jgi:hypothetical protein